MLKHIPVNYDIFEYVAANNPVGARAIINKYGYTAVGVETAADLGEMLKQSIMEVGMPGFKDVLAIHPDRELLMEDFAEKSPLAPPSSTSGCGCGGGCGKKAGGKSATEDYVSSMQQSTGLSLQQGNIFLIGAALILAVAIVSK